MASNPATGIPTSTTFELPGYTVERILGLSWGVIVRSVGLTKGLTGTLRGLKAGEVPQFTEVVDHAQGHCSGSADVARTGTRRQRGPRCAF